MFWLSIISTLLALETTVSAYSFERAKIINQRQVQDEYDYIVVGSGNAGSVIANRLSENEDVSVLVIEAGTLDKNEDSIRLPRNAGAARNTQYDWKYQTIPSSTINNRVMAIPAGKVVGGGTVLNGMAFDRGAAGDYDAWNDLGNEGWGFSSLLPFFKKSETFTPPEPEFAEAFNITYDPEVHGTDGPVYSSYPRFFNPTILNWFRGLATLGIPTEVDGAGGRAINAFWAPNSLHPQKMERSYARKSYHDPIADRSNYHILLSNQVLKLVGSGSPVRITGVQYAASSTAPVQTVTVRKEVIVAGGVIGSPKILQLSGIGPSALLTKLNITTLIDLSGVGTNYQDHSWVSAFIMLQNAPANTIDEATAKRMYEQNQTGPWTQSGPTAFAFLPLDKITGSAPRTAAIIAAVDAQPAAEYLRPNSPAAVVAGYEAQKKVLSTRFATDTMAVSELIFQGGSTLISPAHPLSRGYIELASADPWAAPTIDLRYGSNPVDFDFVSESVRFVRRAMETAPLQELRPRELTPGAQVSTDAQLKTWQQGQLSTMYHSCCTNPMQPEELGGVVDDRARVWGTENLRVVDASIIPLIPGTHLQSTVYAMAEKVAELIKEDA